MNTRLLFGWDNAQRLPKRFPFVLKPQDFESIDTLTLKPEVTEEIAGLLNRESPNNPGFVWIPNLADFIPGNTHRPENPVKHFLEKLTNDIYRVQKNLFNPEGPDNEPIGVYTVQAEDYGTKGVGTNSTKTPHWDTERRLISSAYAPKLNHEGGDPVLADVQQYCMDNGLKLTEVITTTAEDVPHFPHRLVEIRPEHLPEILGKYQIQLNRPQPEKEFGLLILNNYVGQGGVCHGATPVSLLDSTKASMRIFYRMFLRGDVPIKEKWAWIEDLKNLFTADMSR